MTREFTLANASSVYVVQLSTSSKKEDMYLLETSLNAKIFRELPLWLQLQLTCLLPT